MMKRGEVWWVTFEPSVGGEIRKKRLINQAGTVSKTELEGIERAIMIQLDL